MTDKTIIIGGASGYWEDEAMATTRQFDCGDEVFDYINLSTDHFNSAAITLPIPLVGSNTSKTMIETPLVKLAWERSTDKGNKTYIRMIARQPKCIPYI